MSGECGSPAVRPPFLDFLDDGNAACDPILVLDLRPENGRAPAHRLIGQRLLNSLLKSFNRLYLAWDWCQPYPQRWQLRLYERSPDLSKRRNDPQDPFPSQALGSA